MIKKYKPYLELVRIPSIFSAMSNIYAGYFIGRGLLPSVNLILGMLAAAFFIMSGMALNDIADIKKDKISRTNRPLPLGLITLKNAKVISVVLFLIGMLLIWIAQPITLVLCLALGASILAYNFYFKKTLIGPFAMAICRMITLYIGFSLGTETISLYWPMDLEFIRCMLILGGYIALITYLARFEDIGNSSQRISRFIFACSGWAIMTLIFFWFQGLGFKMIIAFICLLIITNIFWKPFKNLSLGADAALTQNTVKLMLGYISLIDVMIMFHANVATLITLVGFVFIYPAKWMGKRISNT